MTRIQHETLTLTRRIGAPPRVVFRAFEDPALKARWFGGDNGPEWATQDYTLDFRTGGSEYGRWKLSAPGKPWDGIHENRTTFLDIEAPERIVWAYTMALNGRVHSASLATLRLIGENGETRIDLTEQLAFYDGSDGIDGRRHGTEALYDSLVKLCATLKEDIDV